MFGLPLPLVIPAMLVAAYLILSGISYLVNANSELARASKFQQDNKRLMEMVDDEKTNVPNPFKNKQGAYDKELESLVTKKRFDDALTYIDERTRLAFEQGNTDREEMYRRYKISIEQEKRELEDVESDSQQFEG